MATYTPDGGAALDFGLLVAGAGRETRELMSERLVLSDSAGSAIDQLGKPGTRIRGQARIDSFAALKTFEGAVGTDGVLVYSEEPDGVDVTFGGLQRTRVTPSGMQLADVEFAINPIVGGVPQRPRHLTLSATATTASGDVPIDNLLSARVSYGFDKRTSDCRLTTPVRPTGVTYDDVLTVVMGAGTHNLVRFVGLVRDFVYQDGAETVTTVAHGYLIRALEYENSEETAYQSWLGAGGILIVDLLGTLTGAPADIVQEVLIRANVPYDAANISGSSVVYGGGLSPLPFMWHSGSPGPNTVPMPLEQGESAMSYIERYDAVDAQIDGPNTGGRYRTFETVGGDVYRVRVGGRPQGTPDFTLTEGVDILSGNFTRSISQTRNYFVVKGQSRGQDPLAFGLQESNDFQPDTERHTYSFASDMIERQTIADDSTINQADTGISCEVIANALALEFNRETVSGYVETFRDDLFGLAQTHLVQGGPGGTVGALGLAENVWVQALDVSIDERGFTQRLSYLGGGLPDESADPVMMRATGRAAR